MEILENKSEINDIDKIINNPDYFPALEKIRNLRDEAFRNYNIEARKNEAEKKIDFVNNFYEEEDDNKNNKKDTKKEKKKKKRKNSDGEKPKKKNKKKKFE